MVTIFDTSSADTDIDIVRLYIYTFKNKWLEKQKCLGKQKKQASVLK